MTGIKTLPGSERPREKMIRSGAGSLSNAELLDTIHSARIGRGTILYMDMGEKELGSRGRRTALANVATELLMKNVKLSFRIVPGGEHCEASWERQIPFFMDTLLYPGNRK